MKCIEWITRCVCVYVCVCMGAANSLIFENFHTVITTVAHGQSVLDDSDVLWAVEAVRLAIEDLDERAVLVEYLNAAVAPVDDDNVVVGVARDARRSVELPGRGAVGAESKAERAVGGEHLDAVVVEVGDDQVAVAHAAHVLRTAERLGRGATVAKAQQKLALVAEHVDEVGLGVDDDQLVAVRSIHAHALGTEQAILAHAIEEAARRLVEHVQTLVLVVDDGQLGRAAGRARLEARDAHRSTYHATVGAQSVLELAGVIERVDLLIAAVGDEDERVGDANRLRVLELAGAATALANAEQKVVADR